MVGRRGQFIIEIGIDGLHRAVVAFIAIIVIVAKLCAQVPFILPGIILYLLGTIIVEPIFMFFLGDECVNPLAGISMKADNPPEHLCVLCGGFPRSVKVPLMVFHALIHQLLSMTFISDSEEFVPCLLCLSLRCHCTISQSNGSNSRSRWR
jgi:hypothetical protein